MVLLPKVYVMHYGVEFPWAENKDAIFNACPDPENPVVFEVHRIRRQPSLQNPLSTQAARIVFLTLKRGVG